MTFFQFSSPGGFRNDDSYEDSDPDLPETTTIRRIAALALKDDGYEDGDPEQPEIWDCPTLYSQNDGDTMKIGPGDPGSFKLQSTL